MYLLYAGFNCTDTPGITGCLGHLIHDRSLISQVWAWFTAHGHEFWEGFKQPCTITTAYSLVIVELISVSDVLAVISAWVITFAVVATIVLGIGFGPRGVGIGKRSASSFHFIVEAAKHSLRDRRRYFSVCVLWGFYTCRRYLCDTDFNCHDRPLVLACGAVCGCLGHSRSWHRLGCWRGTIIVGSNKCDALRKMKRGRQQQWMYLGNVLKAIFFPKAHQ